MSEARLDAGLMKRRKSEFKVMRQTMKGISVKFNLKDFLLTRRDADVPSEEFSAGLQEALEFEFYFPRTTQGETFPHTQEIQSFYVVEQEIFRFHVIYSRWKFPRHRFINSINFFCRIFFILEVISTVSRENSEW